MPTITANKIIFRNIDTYTKMYQGSELIAEVGSSGYDYLTFTAVQAGSTVKFSRENCTSYYSIDNGATWTSGNDVVVTLANIGDSVKYKGVAAGGNYYSTAFTFTGRVAASGSLMSMYNEDPNETTISISNAFQYFFYGGTSLTTAPELPATTLSDNCYMNLFYNCTSLTTAPSLPAMTATNYCYYQMFQGCTSLTTAPQLHATTLAMNCCYSMFAGCTSLTTAPQLPATTLASSCYFYMFSGCTNLITVQTLPATTLDSNCYYGMFIGCNKLTVAPELPATTLASACYRSMFQGCTKLNYIKCLATDISATNCTTRFTQNVASSGTFVKAAGMNDWTTGTSGIPSGWTVQDAS